MADPNLIEFYGRLERLHAARRRGGSGFDPTGTLVRGHPGRKRHHAPFRLMRLAKPVVIILVALVGLKGIIYSEIGSGNYADRLAQLQKGDAIAQAGAVLMRADPLTLYVAGLIGQLRR